MSKHNANVNYVEPNYASLDWKADDAYERAPRLEDYSIMFNIEVEVFNRDNIVNSQITQKDVLVLSCRMNTTTSASTVNFLGGTKIDCHDKESSYIKYLTTNYADMYVGDLINYGTTEMIGVKSVDIEYQKSCVPIITIQFTDVRGLSLFQPTELGRSDVYDGIRGINMDNVAQSFFQCFFKLPSPKYTIYLKGYYGKPVSYEVMCDKFDTKFNSSTGDFDVTARFIGYNYSFLTDVSMDALLAAPYSDYYGEEYWNQAKSEGRFVLYNKDKSMKYDMPTLAEIRNKVSDILKNSKPTEDPVSSESKYHTEEIDTLNSIRLMYSSWYAKLFEALQSKYGNKLCFLFNRADNPYRILILTSDDAVNTNNLSALYNSLSNDFKQINKDLHSAVESYNSTSSGETSGNKITLNNVSLDFSEYKCEPLFNRLYINTKGEISFNDFDTNSKLGKTEVVNKIFQTRKSDGSDEENIDEDRSKNNNDILKTIYNDGVHQYVNCYCIEVPYDGLQERIKLLQSEANSANQPGADQKAREDAMNEFLINEMGWHPSVENFTKIMMAHMETLMYMMYKTVDTAHGRKVSDMNVTVGKDGTCPDVNANSDTLPPFPRVTDEIMGDDGIVKKEDVWIGDVSNNFIEADFVNGLFNGVDKVEALFKAQDIINEQNNNEEGGSTDEDQLGTIIKYPMTPFDLFIKKSPYGNASDFETDTTGEAFSGRVALRMLSILGINRLSSNFIKKNVDKIAQIEAENFASNVKITNDKFLMFIRGNDDLNANKIIGFVTDGTKDKHPWGKPQLFDNNMNFVGYKINGSAAKHVYPIQNETYESIKTSWNKINSNNYEFSDSYMSSPTKYKDNYHQYSKGIYGLGACAIIESYEKVNNKYTSLDSDVNYSSIKDSLFGNGNFLSSYDDVKSSTVGKSEGAFDKNYNLVKMYGWGVDSSRSYMYIDTTKTFRQCMKEENPNNRKVVVSETKKSLDLRGGYEKVGMAMQSNLENANKKPTKEVVYYQSSLPNDSNNIVIDGQKLSQREAILAKAITCIHSKGISEFVSIKNVFTKMPKYYALKVGALVCASRTVDWSTIGGGNKNKIYDRISISVPLNNSYTWLIDKMIPLTPMIRAEYAKYFINWCRNSNAAKELYEIVTNDKYYDSNGKLLATDKTVQNVSKDLTKIVLVTYLTDMHNKDMSAKMNKSVCKTYLDSFIKKLREIYGGEQDNYSESDNTNSGETTVSSPNKSTNDMKKGLYNYLKLLYDKWVPSSSFDNWKVENYFPDDNGEENIGDKFYFIDSYYNKIGQKLLINPERLFEKIDALLSYKDVNVMMLGFMADIYSMNKCMFMAIQNFSDLSKQGSMNEMFKPIPHNAIDWGNINKHPSFVVVYPYEPSKHLNVSNSDYSDDGFMLNDEAETPIAIRSRSGDNTYCIPAFGVTYGRQYQSYFKNVNINMQSPIATQQSIKAKHYILRDANGDKKAVGCGAQDLYDIYSTQSYTCDVTMMGCAWIQPLMYFVLLNVPMFRGSYMIMKVKHTIRPGNMETTFTGCRMAAVSNSLVEKIFTDDLFNSGNENTITKEELANVDNNCPYKVYPLFQASYDDVAYTYPQDKSDKSFAKTMFCAYKKYNASLNDELVIGLVAQDCHESGWGSKKSGSYNFGGIKSYGAQAGQSEYHNFASIDDYVNGKINHVLNKNFKGWSGATSPEEYVNELQVKHKPTVYAKDTAYLSKLRPMFDSVRKRISSFIKEMNDASKKKDKTLTNEDVANALFEALQKSINSTPSINVKLKKTYNKNKSLLMIQQDNGKSDYLGNVFDLLLNGYYDYIKDLYWVYGSKGGNTGDPLHIDVVVSLSPKANQRLVYACESKNIEKSKKNNIGKDANKKLRLALFKKYGSVNKEVPQVKDKSTYEGLTIADCDDIIRTMTMGQSSSIGGSISQKKIELFGQTWTGRKSKAWCESFLKDVTISYRSKPNVELENHTVKFHRKLEGNLQGLFNELATHKDFYIHEFSTYDYRNVVGSSTPKLSNHSYGIAFDLNPHYNPYIKNGVVKGGANIYDSTLSMRSSSNWVVQTCAKYGFGWGGWYKDYMHFSYFDGR